MSTTFVFVTKVFFFAKKCGILAELHSHFATQRKGTPMSNTLTQTLTATETATDTKALELARQLDYIQKIKAFGPKFFKISTYGCQMNERDSEKIAGMLRDMGYQQTEDTAIADLVIFNTCSVRENAENRLYGNLGKIKAFKQQNPDMKVILCGCMMQQDIVIDKIMKSYNYVDIIFGTFNIYRMPQLLHTSYETGEQIIDIWKEHQEIIEDLPSERVLAFKANVNIMFGCSKRCTFCIVPFVRGRERSRPIEDIITEIKQLASEGVVEVLLLGQNVNSYGKTFVPKVSFANLLREVNKIEGIERIRFVTSHPMDFSDDLIDAMATCDKVCKQLHLPVQSGSNRILLAMKRNHTAEHYLDIINRAKARMPGIIITTDLIVGFPTETDEDNEATIELIKQVEYSNAFSFIYSKREGTPAALMEQVPEHVVKERFAKVLDVLKPISLKINRQQIGTTGQVLVESLSKNDATLVSGRLDNGLLVHLPGTPAMIGQFVSVKIVDCKTYYLIGEAL